MKLEKAKNGWESDSPLILQLNTPIEDVKKFGENLYNYISKTKLPFRVRKIYLLFEKEQVNEEFSPFYEIGYLVMEVKRKSLMSMLNPFHDTLRGDETIVIRWQKGEDNIISYQEVKHDCGVVWIFKLTLEQLKAYKELLLKFTSKDCFEKEDNPSKRG